MKDMNMEPAPSLTPMIYGQIARVMSDIGAIGKNQKNEQQGYKFRGIEDLYNAAHPVFVKHGIFCCPTVLEFESSDRVRKSGSIALRVIMKVCHKFYAADGSFVEVTTIGEAIDDADKASNKCMSAAMKYALIELFCVPTQDLEDGDRVTPEAGAKIAEAAKTQETRTFKTKPAPEVPAEGNGFIDRGRQVNFAKSFREALPKGDHRDAEIIRHRWLGDNGFVDRDGSPSSTMILMEDFEQAKKKACEYAAQYRKQITDDDIPF